MASRRLCIRRKRSSLKFTLIRMLQLSRSRLRKLTIRLLGTRCIATSKKASRSVRMKRQPN